MAADLGLQPGDVVVAVDDRAVSDAMDFLYRTSGGLFTMLVDGHAGKTLYEIEVDQGEPLGLTFAEPLFDGMRTCRNACRFCFVKQMPAGLRPSLSVRDDDYRLSFLNGSFVTLTNLSAADWRRLRQQRLSPLYVSVHATEQGLRDRLLGICETPPLMEKLRLLASAGISLHAQIVVVPGVNDGEHLERSLEDLRALGPTILSVSIVPVGLTRYADTTLRRPTADEARTILAQTTRWRRRFRRDMGRSVVCAADEWYLLGGVPLPSSRYYEGFPQAENGVGLTRLLLDHWASSRRRLRGRSLPHGRRVVVCGTLVAPVWQGIAAEMTELGAEVTVLPVINRVLGETVTISGLLFAEDVIAALAGTGPWAAVYLPRSMFNHDGVTLDDRTPQDISRSTGYPVVVGDEAAAVLAPLPA